MSAVDVRKINETFSVAGQIDVAQVVTLAQAGFKTIICNRPDDEQPGQPAYAAIEAAARDAGLVIHYIPVSLTGMTYDNVDATRAALADAPTPILAYCRSGARSTQLYGVATGRA